MDIALNVTSRNEHVPEIKRCIRTIKERFRATANSLPFRKYLSKLITEMVYNVVFWLNSLLHKEGVHTTISPRTLLTGLKQEQEESNVKVPTQIQLKKMSDQAESWNVYDTNRASHRSGRPYDNTPKKHTHTYIYIYHTDTDEHQTRID